MVKFKFKLLHLAFFRRPFSKRNTADTVLLMGLLVNMVCAVELLVVFYRMVNSSIDFMRQLGDVNTATDFIQVNKTAIAGSFYQNLRQRFIVHTHGFHRISLGDIDRCKQCAKYQKMRFHYKSLLLNRV